MSLDKELGFLLFSETLAEGATLAKRVAQFVFLETFAEVRCHGRVKNFRKTLLLNLSKTNLSAMVQATGDNATVVQNSDVSVKRVTGSRD